MFHNLKENHLFGSPLILGFIFLLFMALAGRGYAETISKSGNSFDCKGKPTQFKLEKHEIKKGGKIFSPTTKLDNEYTYKEFIIRLYPKPFEMDGSLEILQNNRRIFGENIGDGTVATTTTGQPVVGMDINGNGIPDLVVGLNLTGGKYCCGIYYFFELNAEMKAYKTLNFIERELNFWDFDGDGIMEATTGDDSFGGFSCYSNAERPGPKVIFRLKGDEYVIAPDLMKKDPPGYLEFAEMIKEVEVKPGQAIEKTESLVVSGSSRRRVRVPSQTNPVIPAALGQKITELTYSGQFEIAKNLWEAAWSNEIPGKRKFWEEFISQLSNSPFCEEIRKINEKK